MERAQGFSMQGGQVVFTAGIPSQTMVQVSYPHSTITVFFAGTTMLAVLYADNQPHPTPQGNPFTANQYGYWWFYAANGRYDVMMDHPDMPAPWTMGDILLFDPEGAVGTNQTPWTQNIDGGGFDLSNVNIIDVTGGYEINGQEIALWLLGSAGQAYYMQGNVGIKNANPSHDLDVTGNVNVTGAFMVNGVPISTGGGVGNFWTATGSAGAIYYSGGNVGIGTNTPAVPLQVSGMASATSYAVNASPTIPVINANGAFVGAGVNVGQYGIQAAACSLTGQGLQPNSTVLSIYGTGAGGVPGAVPADVQVNGSIEITGQMWAATYVVLNSSGQYWFGVPNGTFTTGDGQTATVVQGLIVALSGGGGGGGTFWASAPGGAGAIYYSAGFVGIGKNNPAYALDVTGNINVTGQFLVNGVAIGTGGGGNFWQAGAAGAIYYIGGNVGIGTNTPPAGDLFSVNGLMSATGYAMFANPTVPVINTNGAFVGSGVDVTGQTPVPGPNGGVRCINLQANSVSVLGPIEGIQTAGNEGALLALGAVVSADASAATTGGSAAQGGYYTQPLNQSPILAINYLGQFVGPGINIGTYGISAGYCALVGATPNQTVLSIYGSGGSGLGAVADVQVNGSIEITGQMLAGVYGIIGVGFGLASQSIPLMTGYTVTVTQGLVTGYAFTGGSANLSVASLSASGGVTAGSYGGGQFQGSGVYTSGNVVCADCETVSTSATQWIGAGLGYQVNGFTVIDGSRNVYANVVTASGFSVAGGSPGVSIVVSWYGASSSGGPANVGHQIVVENGIVVSGY